MLFCAGIMVLVVGMCGGVVIGYTIGSSEKEGILK